MVEAICSWAHMGGYASYVWSTYALAGGILGYLGFKTWWHQQRVRRQLHQWVKRLST